jgi:hypothetical protein
MPRTPGPVCRVYRVIETPPGASLPLLDRNDLAGVQAEREVGTDGLYNHVDRDLGLPELEREIERRVAEAFWARKDFRPWGAGAWFPRAEGSTGVRKG